MSNIITRWRPSFWTQQVHGSAWDRVKAAMERDWAQTKHDLSLGGHEMNQTFADTIDQAAGLKHLPTMNQANPPRVIREWSEAEIAYSFGHAARQQFGAEYPQWNEALELKLKNEWMASVNQERPDWALVVLLVRRAYEFQDRAGAAASGAAAPAPKSGELSPRS